MQFFFLKTQSRNLFNGNTMERRYQKPRNVILAADGAYCGCYRHDDYYPIIMWYFHTKTSLFWLLELRWVLRSLGWERFLQLEKFWLNFLLAFNFRIFTSDPKGFPGSMKEVMGKVFCSTKKSLPPMQKSNVATLRKNIPEWRNSLERCNRGAGNISVLRVWRAYME